MTLAFLDPSRNFDGTRNAARFVGHDGMFEIRFLVEAAAFQERQTRVAAMPEAECLSAFDAMRASMEDVARAVYARRRGKPTPLSVSDFR